MEARHARKTTAPQATGHRSSVWGARERGPSSARTGLLSLAQARPKAQGLQANRPFSTSRRRHPAKLRHSQCSFYAIFNVVFTPFSVWFLRLASLARRSLNNPIAELPGFWDALSIPGPYRKTRPVLRHESGTRFPFDALTGKYVPLWGSIPGRAFRQEPQRESASHSGQQFRGVLRYPRSHISANEISVVSPLLAAASWHPCVKPRFEKIA